MENIVIVNGYNHPRLIVHDFTVAEKTLSFFLNKVTDNKIIRPAPVVIMHVTERLEGGLAEIEARALREVAAAAGAREVYVWDGRELTDSEILQGTYPTGAWLSPSPKKSR